MVTSYEGRELFSLQTQQGIQREGPAPCEIPRQIRESEPTVEFAALEDPEPRDFVCEDLPCRLLRGRVRADSIEGAHDLARLDVLWPLVQGEELPQQAKGGDDAHDPVLLVDDGDAIGVGLIHRFCGLQDRGRALYARDVRRHDVLHSRQAVSPSPVTNLRA